MSLLKRYSYKIGEGVVNQGHISGTVVFEFNKNGLNFVFQDIDKSISAEKVDDMSFKTKLLNKIQKGSTLATLGAWTVATNKKVDIGTKIALSKRMAEAGRDKTVQKKYSVVEFYNNNKFFSVILNKDLNPDLKQHLNLAYNNPKSFFQKTLKENLVNFSTRKKRGKLFWIIYWFFLSIGIFAGIGASADTKFLFILPEPLFWLFIVLLLIYPIYSRIKFKKSSKSNLTEIMKTKEYETMLKKFEQLTTLQ